MADKEQYILANSMD